MARLSDDGLVGKRLGGTVQAGILRSWINRCFAGVTYMGRTKTVLPSDSEALRINGLLAPVEVRRHPAARRMTLRVSRTRRAVIVTVPMQCDLAQAGSFLNSHIDWVREHLGAVPQPVPFTDGAIIPFRGRPHILCFTGVRGGPPVQIEQANAPDLNRLTVSGALDAAPRRVSTWLMEQARQDLDRSVQVHAARLGVRPKRIALRDQSSRWGSCSTTRVLSFSWRLVLAPPTVLDYVAAHEVAHLAQMNHGPKFWALVARTMPQMQDAREWLRAYGMGLHRYGQG